MMSTATPFLNASTYLSLQRFDLGLEQPVLEHSRLAAGRIISRGLVGSWVHTRWVWGGGWMRKG